MRKLLSQYKRFTPHIVALGFYVLVTGLSLDRLLLHFGQVLPGDGQHYDYAIFSWDIWWMRHALVDMQTNPFTTDLIVYPFTHTLVTHTLVPFWGFLSIPLQPFIGIASILSTFIAISFLLTAYFTFLFAYRHGCSWSLAFIAGTLMTFTPPMIHRATEGHLNLLAMWWIPLSLLAFDSICYSRRFGSALSLALCLYAALLTDFQYMMWIPLVLIPYALVKFLSPGFRSDRNRHHRLVGRLSLALLIFICLILLYPVPQLLQLNSSGYSRASLETAHYYSFSLSALFRGGVADFTIGRMIVPLATGLGIWGRSRKGNKLWLVIAVTSLFLAVGPYLPLELFSKTIRIPLPYCLLHRLFDGQYRAPVRFAVLAVFGLSMFVALEGQALLNHFKITRSLRFGLAGSVLFLIVLDYGLLRPFPIFYPKNYTVYQDIANDPNNIVVLEVPLGVDTGYTLFGHGQQLIYYQPIHRKRILNGALSRMPLAAVDYFRSYNLLQAIAGKEEIDTAATRELAQLVEQWNIGYVLIHRDLLSNDELQQLLPFFATHPSLCFWRTEEDLLAYRTRPSGSCPSMEGTIRVNMGSPESDAYAGTGWFLSENIGGVMGRWAGNVPTATLRVDLKPQTYCIRFRAWAYPPNQTVTLDVNDMDIAVLPMSETWTIYTTTIPAAAIRIGEATMIQFNHASLLSPHKRTQGNSSDQRDLAAAYEWVMIEPCIK